ncbi:MULTISPECIES: autotransporter outer membrane beta-barrel domain-containing protein [unclassified Pseudomonas]|uniref:autotransporter outer membrane beta-barrel domain-containing protein n=1 Tax=unclassified Pseudomonas TaxID=196821 RepID=UPI002006A6D1|nr:MULTISPECIES: autotransporter outer membrane beta-barrel domain-containing protein [unclassified Pseudomonas]MCK6190799.1 autotransporter outer membrane beta-barrel domain-containing protein [Pseudomonas sp. EYE_354]WLH70768.1 autotransporter outer membrane beta-barrel domain-containing protein [Pseudomonas sp. FP2309]
MSALNMFELKPLSAIMKVPTITFCMFVAVQGQAQAVPLVGEQRAIDSTTPVTDWQLSSLSTLDMNGASATVIDLSDSTLNMNPGSSTNDIRAVAGSIVNINSSSVSSTNTTFAAVRLENSSASINNSTITSTGSVGLQALGIAGDPRGSSVDVTASTISGVRGGAQASSGSQLNFKQNTQVSGTGAGASGLSLQGGTATASQSTITGAGNGVVFIRDPRDTTDGKLVLDQSVVEGTAGSAIVVRGAGARAPVVSIDVLNGSTLKGGDGNLLNVSGGGSATMTVDNSRNLLGNVVADATSTIHLTLRNNAELSGKLENVSSLNVGDASNWNMTGDSSVGALNMAGGTVTMGAPNEFYQLNLATLSGNGTFVMDTYFHPNDGKTDYINVTGEATGSHSLALSASGAELVKTKVVHTGGGDAVFSLEGGPVDAGAYAYGLKKEGNDWFLDTENRVISRSARVVTALFNTPVTVMTAEEGSLRARMGELRYSPKSTGLWIRGFGSKYDVSQSSGTGYTQNLQGFSIGADMPLGDSQWKVGVFGGHSNSDVNPVRGSSGTVKSYFLGTYATWMDDESGFYFDAVAKANRFHNEVKATLSDNTSTKGNYSNVGGGLSAEFGRHINIGESSYIEPYGRVSTIVVQGGTYSLKNGLQVDGERTRSRTAEAGATIGHEFQLDDGTLIKPYLRAAMVHEFADNNKVLINNQAFNNDLSGSRSKYGAGVAVKFTEDLQMHADVETSTSDKIKQKAAVNVGLRYAF